MARNKKNPDNRKVLLVLAVLILGGYVVHRYSNKKKLKALPPPPEEDEIIVEPDSLADESMFSIGPDCTRQEIPFTPENRDYAESLINEALDAIGGYAVMPELAPLPGDPEITNQFLQAWATQIFVRTVHPNCINELGIDVQAGVDENAFGPNYFPLFSSMPADAGTYLRELVVGLQKRFEDLGFDTGGNYPDGTPTTEETILGFGLTTPIFPAIPATVGV